MSKSISRFGVLLQHLIHGPPVSPPDHPIRTEERESLGRVNRVAEEHLADPLCTTADAAECLGLSRVHLNRKLRSLTGRSTHQLLQEMRLESARRILLSESLPVTAVAERVGF